MKNRPRVGILGGGIFGLSCAINLGNEFDVTIFEQGQDILSGATYANHNRHHYGFHYPRSLETAQQCLSSSKEFEKVYGECINWDFDNYYCVSKECTKTTPENYLIFCDQLGLEYSESWPDNQILDRTKIALCLKVKEGIYNFDLLKNLVKERIYATSSTKIKLKHRVISGYINEIGTKVLNVEKNDEICRYEFDFVINAMYANHNRFCEWFGFEKHLFQFNLQELDIVELPVNFRFGITVQDGPFPSILPLGSTNYYLLAHVETSQLVRDISSNLVPLLNRVSIIESNWEGIQESCSEYIPIIKNARLIRSIFVDRVVDGTKLKDDARLTETTYHGNGCWSIFAAKIITCEMTAKKVVKEIKDLV